MVLRLRRQAEFDCILCGALVCHANFGDVAVDQNRFSRRTHPAERHAGLRRQKDAGAQARVVFGHVEQEQLDVLLEIVDADGDIGVDVES
jgi:hypothetical protein